MNNFMSRLIVITALVTACFSTNAEEYCGDISEVRHELGDYSDPKYHGFNSSGKISKDYLKTVERRHFDKNVENLTSGITATDPYSDLVYTLNHFPNHYKALLALINYDKSRGGKLPKSGKYDFTQSVRCYFKRAMQFKPNDVNVLHLYAIYFYKNKKFKESINFFKMANDKLFSAELVYNIGLAYFELGEFQESKKYAEQAYNKKFPLLGLKNKLSAKGVELELQ